jgi:hypothetical protein
LFKIAGKRFCACTGEPMVHRLPGAPFPLSCNEIQLLRNLKVRCKGLEQSSLHQNCCQAILRSQCRTCAISLVFRKNSTAWDAPSSLEDSNSARLFKIAGKRFCAHNAGRGQCQD